jgi:3-dehydroquinate synthase
MTRVHVDLGDRSYDVGIGDGSLSSVGSVLKSLGARGRVAVVSDSNVAPLYGGVVTECVAAAGLAPRLFTVPAGEQSKSIERLKGLWDAFVAFDMDRSSSVVALGGGVVGDLAGFAAATYMRGIRYVQAPTTMLACVDSSVGGKTAVDLESGKNLVGAFHQPAAVIIDPTVLRTLPKRELRAGLAEVIKTGVIMDDTFFARLESEMDALLALAGPPTLDAIRRCVELKAAVAAEDERESSGRRAILNYGHTVGHALETLGGYGELIHGEAVAVGMVAASRVAEKLHMASAEVTMRQEALLQRAGLPTTLRSVRPADVLAVMRHDKKARGGTLTMVLPTRIGEVRVVNDVPPETVKAVLEDLLVG